ncbi:MAG TPA: TonB-dependent receptor [Asticcacaulis sp.]|nr:TonB-dependent receptor [Asticcacaulis sp.]
MIALISGAALPALAHADDGGEIVITGHATGREVATTESVTADDIGRTTNAATPEDSLRYMPNLLVRQRHIGDTQSPVSTRTSGVGASARSLIYADGILLSSLIGNNNTSASPKWGLVAPEAIERVDVLYGPFSAAYAGNSLGAVIEFTTRAPTRLEGAFEVQGGSQAFAKYGDDADYGTARWAGSVGDRFGKAAFRLSFNHLDSRSQPLGYATATVPAANSSSGVVVSGAFDDANRTGAAIKVLGATGLEHQVQDNLSGRLTYDLTPGLTAAYTFGLFRNVDDATVNSYLRDGSGAPVYAGSLNIGGKAYTVAASAFSNSVYRVDETQLAQGLSLKSHNGGAFDYEIVATRFDYLGSRQRTPTGALPAGLSGGGSSNELDGTGWSTFDAKGLWRLQADHRISFGFHEDKFHLSNPKYALSDWRNGDDGALQTLSQGRTRTQAIWVQDVWALSPTLKATTGVRFEDWWTSNGRNYSATPALDTAQPVLKRTGTSPKLVIAWTPLDAWTFKGSVGVAYRFPTVTELYQTVTTGTTLSVPDPNLRPERAVSSELSTEKTWKDGRFRVSLFDETVRNALLSQSAPLVAGSSMLFTYVQNVDRTHANGIELVADQTFKTFQLSGWLTYTDARTARDAAFPAAQDKQLPQVPRLRGALVATWSPTPKFDLSLAGRYSDRMFATLDNSDSYANTYQGFSGYFVADIHARYKLTPHWTLDAGVNNLNNRSYFLFHPFTQRTVLVDLKYVL